MRWFCWHDASNQAAWAARQLVLVPTQAAWFPRPPTPPTHSTQKGMYIALSVCRQFHLLIYDKFAIPLIRIPAGGFWLVHIAGWGFSKFALPPEDLTSSHCRPMAWPVRSHCRWNRWWRVWQVRIATRWFGQVTLFARWLGQFTLPLNDLAISHCHPKFGSVHISAWVMGWPVTLLLQGLTSSHCCLRFWKDNNVFFLLNILFCFQNHFYF